MNVLTNKTILGSLTALALVASKLVYADAVVTVPSLPCQYSASLGTFYAAPSVDNQAFANRFSPNDTFTFINNPVNVQTNYDWGFTASLGYIFNNTANGIELLYRGINTTSDKNFVHSDTGVMLESIPVLLPGATDAVNQVGYKYHSLDLMLSQLISLGSCAQVRFLLGLAYVEINESSNTNVTGTPEPNPNPNSNGSIVTQKSSQFNGLGPRLGMDVRRDFCPGFGLIGSGSIAYFQGDMTFSEAFAAPNLLTPFSVNDSIAQHAVLNFRGKVGIDYQYCFDSTPFSSAGVEVGYQADYYNNAVVDISSGELFPAVVTRGTPTYLNSSTKMLSTAFNGPYLIIKAKF